ncbi:MAG: dihydroneopterin aldolase [Bacteroidota bacterium]|jgi:dihydroneopterin aldolase
MKYQSGLQGVEFYAYHGVYGEEQKTGGLFRVDLWVTVLHQSDFERLSALINYETLYAIASQEMQKTTPLIETVAHRILLAVQNKLPECDEIRVCIQKPQAAGLLKSGCAVVEIMWVK